MSQPHNDTTVSALRCSPPCNMSLGEAAIYLGISQRKLWAEVSAKHVRAARIGRRLILARTELDRYLAVQAALGA